MNARRLIVSVYLFIFVAMLSASAVFFWRTRAEYRQLREVEARSQRRLAELETKLREQELVLQRLRNDPAYLEQVIRKQLRYVKPDEFLFRFDE